MLPQKHKLKKEDFNGFQRWKTAQSPHLTLRIKTASRGELSRFAFVVAKKISKKSVTRNKLKRFGYRAVGEIIKDAPNGFLCAFFFRGAGADKLSYKTVREETLFLLKKVGFLP